MTPRWKIRRFWSPSQNAYLWWVGPHDSGVTQVFRLWENAILYVDIQEAAS